MSAERFCVFCGQNPVEKNKEHVLPQWLLQMTGDPSRVVKFGMDFENQKVIAFSWSSLVMPSCAACNTVYSQLESKTKPIVEALLQRQSIVAAAYLTLLDWLDKVRVGLWLAYHRLQKNPTSIQPRFHITSRVGTKDRLVAVYPIDTSDRGLNAFGVESFMFHRTPSCFGLRVNNLLMLNLSADFLFAARCGFPFPRVRELLIDGANAGMLRLADFTCTRRVRHPIMRKRLHKSSVLVYQPIMQRTTESGGGHGFLGNFSTFDSFLAKHTLPPYLSGKGVLFRQHTDRVEVITDLSQEIEFDSITGRECRSMYSLVAQVYDFQNFVQDLFEPAASDARRSAHYREQIKVFRKHNERVSSYLRKQPLEHA